MFRNWILVFLSAGAGGLLTFFLLHPPSEAPLHAQPPLPGPAGSRLAAPEPRFAPPAADPELTPEEQVHVGVYDAVNRSVVNITTKSVRPDAFLLFEVPTEGAGSGSVLDRHGHILTNHHVIVGAREIQVTLFNGQTYTAGLVGQDPTSDIAVLRIDAPAEDLFPVVPGDAARLRVGQKVIAIGNPFGLERTMTVGIVSSLNRSLPSQTGRTMKQLIQIDAALNRGNSGGPLLDSRGRMIGMNTAIASSNGQNSGVGFAIPASTIQRVVPLLIRDGKVSRADLGISRVLETDSGLLLATLEPGGPAERAGLRGFRVVREQQRRGAFIYESTRVDRSYADLLTKIDDQPVRTVDDLLSLIEQRKPGDPVRVTIVRDGREQQLPVTLGASE